MPNRIVREGFFIEINGSKFKGPDSNFYKIPTGRTRPHLKKNKAQQQLRYAVFLRDGFKCRYCHAEAIRLTEDFNGAGEVLVDRKSKTSKWGHHATLHMDHIIPMSSGGSWHPDNMQTLCSVCNCSKGNR